MSFIVRNPGVSAVTITNLGQRIEPSEEFDLQVPFTFEQLEEAGQDITSSGALGTLLTAGTLERMDQPGGVVIPPAQAFDDAVLPHADSHKVGEADELDVTGLTGLLATAQTPVAHGAAEHSGSIGTHSQITGVGATDHHDNSNDPTADQKAALNAAGAINGANPLVAQGTFDTHATSTANPHSVTAAQAGAPTLAAFNAHTGASNPHGITPAGIGAVATADLDTAGNPPTLDGAGKLKTTQLPATAITDTFVVASQAAQTALTAEVGDCAIRTDEGKSYLLRAEPASTFSNWEELLAPTGGVTSVNGQTGVVTLDTDDVSEGSTNQYYTEARVTANASVAANTAHAASTANPHSVTKAQVGLTNVENILNNFAATADPGVTNDSGEGYQVGSRWVNVTLDKGWTCLDAAAGAAVWRQDTNDTGVTAPIETFDGYFSGSTSIPEARTDVSLSTQRTIDAAAFTHSAGTPTVTIVATGRYFLHADAYFDSNVNNRVFYEIAIQRNGTDIPATVRRGGYARNTAIDETRVATPMIAMELTAGDQIKVQVMRVVESSNGTTNLVAAELLIFAAKGLKGETGPQGPAGTAQLNIEDTGSALGQFDTINFEGLTVTDEGSGEVKVKSESPDPDAAVDFTDHFTEQRLDSYDIIISGGTVAIQDLPGGVMRLDSPAGQGQQQLRLKDNIFTIAHGYEIKWRMRLLQAISSWELGLRPAGSTSPELNFRNQGGSSNFEVQHPAGAVVTSVAMDTAWHTFEIIATAGGTQVEWKIDGTVVHTQTASLPADAMSWYTWVDSGPGQLQLDLDYVRYKMANAA